MSRRAKLSLTADLRPQGRAKGAKTCTRPRRCRFRLALAGSLVSYSPWLSSPPPCSPSLPPILPPPPGPIQNVRRAAGLSTLTLDNRLIDLARDRSADMANRRYFDHYTPEGRTFLDMMRQRGIPFRMAGEIIAQNNYQAAQTAEQAYQAFMGSSEHHRIIMMGNWRTVGLGQAVDGNGMYYYTVLFSQPR